jgi:cytochrome c biogenesis protein CcmG/thiol:disulfide interchange protein DsbE
VVAEGDGGAGLAAERVRVMVRALPRRAPGAAADVARQGASDRRLQLQGRAGRGGLAKHGDPYAAVVADRTGAVAFDYGVYGVPETFLVDRTGTIRFKHVGPLTPEVVQGKLLPLVRELSR